MMKSNTQAAEVKIPPSSAFGATVVFVTSQKECQRLIKAGASISEISHTPLYVVSVQRTDVNREDSQILEYLFERAKEFDAAMTVYYSDNPKRTMSDCIKQYRANHIITGIPAGPESMLVKLWNRFKESNFYIVESDGTVVYVNSEMKESFELATTHS